MSLEFPVINSRKGLHVVSSEIFDLRDVDI